MIEGILLNKPAGICRRVVGPFARPLTRVLAGWYHIKQRAITQGRRKHGAKRARLLRLLSCYSVGAREWQSTRLAHSTTYISYGVIYYSWRFVPPGFGGRA